MQHPVFPCLADSTILVSTQSVVLHHIAETRALLSRRQATAGVAHLVPISTVLHLLVTMHQPLYTQVRPTTLLTTLAAHLLRRLALGRLRHHRLQLPPRQHQYTTKMTKKQRSAPSATKLPPNGVCSVRPSLLCLFKASLTRRSITTCKDNCTHTFCMPCIISWTTPRGDQTYAEAEAGKTCPSCRTRCQVIVPSEVFLREGEDKKRRIKEYKGELAFRISQALKSKMKPS